MRLLNTRTLELKDFVGCDDVPPYAILSHTWEDEEVSFQEIEISGRLRTRRASERSILTCRQARSNGIDYAWVDTCCIDRTNGAELSEAINSMFRWYERSQVCYAYLSTSTPRIRSRQSAAAAGSRAAGRLQELIAPSTVEFCDQTWTFRGSKAHLMKHLQGLTGIDLPRLDEFQRLQPGGSRRGRYRLSCGPKNVLGIEEGYHAQGRCCILPSGNIRRQHASCVRRGRGEGVHPSSAGNHQGHT